MKTGGVNLKYIAKEKKSSCPADLQQSERSKQTVQESYLQTRPAESRQKTSFLSFRTTLSSQQVGSNQGSIVSDIPNCDLTAQVLLLCQFLLLQSLKYISIQIQTPYPSLPTHWMICFSEHGGSTWRRGVTWQLRHIALYSHFCDTIFKHCDLMKIRDLQ